MASKKQVQDTTPKISVTENVSLELAVNQDQVGFGYVGHHQASFAVLEEYVDQVKDYFGLEAALSLVNLNITNAGITASVRTEK